jgi:hypothetical protein
VFGMGVCRNTADTRWLHRVHSRLLPRFQCHAAFAVSLGDAIDHLGEGRVLAALKTLATGRNVTSIRAIIENAGVLSGLAELG